MYVRAPGRIAAAALLLVLLSTVCHAGPSPAPDFYNFYSVYRGFYDNDSAWFICTSASSIAFADSTFFATMWNPWFPEKPVLAPRLADALDVSPEVARPMYLVVNSGQGPVFDTRPGSDDYSGLWQVFLIRFNPGFVRPVTNTSTSDPQGLPTPSEGEIVETNAVVNCPILATSSLGGPAWPAPPESYRIRQAIYWILDSIPRSVLLPIYYCYISDPVSGRPVLAGVSVTDAETQELADLFQANFAPRLADFPDTSAKACWVMAQPCPPGQLPVLEEAPWWLARAYDPLYSPVMRYSELGRTIPPWSMITSRQLLKSLLDRGLLFEIYGGKINTNVVQAY